MCRGRHYSFLWIAPLYPWYAPYNAECQAKRYQVPFLKSLVWPNLGLNPSLNLIIIYQMSFCRYWSISFDPISTRFSGIVRIMPSKVLNYIRRSGSDWFLLSISLCLSTLLQKTEVSPFLYVLKPHLSVMCKAVKGNTFYLLP